MKKERNKGYPYSRNLCLHWVEFLRLQVLVSYEQPWIDKVGCFFSSRSNHGGPKINLSWVLWVSKECIIQKGGLFEKITQGLNLESANYKLQVQFNYLGMSRIDFFNIYGGFAGYSIKELWMQVNFIVDFAIWFYILSITSNFWYHYLK